MIVYRYTRTEVFSREVYCNELYSTLEGARRAAHKDAANWRLSLDWVTLESDPECEFARLDIGDDTYEFCVVPVNVLD